MTAFPHHQKALATLESRGRYRRLLPRAGHDFASNDYLGLAGDDMLRSAAMAALARGVPVGAGGSRLLRGNHDEHAQLEAEAAAFFGTDGALFMGGGFNANLAIFSSLPQKDDLVLYDALIHASTHDGMRLGRAETRRFAHNDSEAAARAIDDWRAAGGTGRVWIAVEAVYSMDGDLAPLARFKTLADARDAVLVVDEAHATGLFGHRGEGRAHAIAGCANVLCLHTCGKALGASGALICGDRVLIDTLVNRARAFIFATAPSPLNAALVRAALQELRDNPARRDAAWRTIEHAHAEAERLCGLSGFECQILPVVLAEERRTMAAADALQTRGYDIRGIRPPAVPRGTCRLRISITPNTSKDTISRMFADLSDVLAHQP